MSEPKKVSVSASGMEAILAHAVIRPGAKSAEGRAETRAAKALNLQILGSIVERPLTQTFRARSAEGKQVALVMVGDSATAAERERFARVAEDLLAAGDAVSGVQRVRAVAPTRDGFASDLWTTGTATDLPTLRWPLRRRLDFARLVVNALESLHGVGLVHGCLCAANVLLDDDLNPVLSEAGMVSVHALGQRDVDAGYSAFAAPEVNEGEPAGVRSDVYSAGRLVEQFVAGENAPQVAEVVSRCLSRDPQARYASAAELSAALGAAVEQLPEIDGPSKTEASPVPSPAPTRPMRDMRSRPEIAVRESPEKTRASSGPPARWPALVGAAAIALAMALGFVAGGANASVGRVLPILLMVGVALATWIVPPLSKARLASRVALALGVSALVAVVDPLGYAYRSAAQRRLRGDPATRRAAIEEVLRLGRDFRGMSLAGVDLSDIDMTGADLRDVDLSQSDLSRARLWGAELDGASLDSARLMGTNLEQTAIAQALHADSASCDAATRPPRGWKCINAHLARTGE